MTKWIIFYFIIRFDIKYKYSATRISSNGTFSLFWGTSYELLLLLLFLIQKTLICFILTNEYISDMLMGIGLPYTSVLSEKGGALSVIHLYIIFESKVYRYFHIWIAWILTYGKPSLRNNYFFSRINTSYYTFYWL